MTTFEALDLLGVATFAASGVIVAARHRLDAFGALTVALVTALGGGTLRDLLLGLTPVFWIVDSRPILVAIGAAALCFGAIRVAAPPRRTFLLLDALGLGTFAALGAARALEAGAGWGVAALMGMLSGAAGGALRDVLCGEVPTIFRAEIYATAALIGAAVCALSLQMGFEKAPALLVGATLTFALRLLALRLDAQLPLTRAASRHESADSKPTPGQSA